MARVLIGDQVRPSISLQASGGFLVWEDNATDGDGLGISARRIDSNGLGSLGVFRVNETGAVDQQNARVRVTKSGEGIFVWQGGSPGNQEIYARFVDSKGVFATGELLVNTEISGQQANPALALLSDGMVAVTWSSFGQDGSLQGVFGQVLSSTGKKIGTEFRVNQFTRANQRTPTVAGLADGSYVVAWVSEQQRFENSVDIYARVFSPVFGAIGDEILVNTSTNLCANPELSAVSSGGFLAGWSERDLGAGDNSWDIQVRAFDSTGNPVGAANTVNTHQSGSHFAPQIASNGRDQMVVWTSMGQDGSAEGVFGRFINSSGEGESAEFQINTFSQSKQMHPVVASDGGDQFIAAWTSFIGGVTSFDLFAQRYGLDALKPLPPFVSALSSTKLSITWPGAGPSTVSGYEVYVDGNVQPMEVSQNVATISTLVPGSNHSIRIAYRFVDGSKSALSEPATGTTWGSDENLDGLPDDWQTTYWGADSFKWPEPKSDGDGDGASNLQEFLAGTNPVESSSVLRMQIDSSTQGNFLNWNSKAGFVYQVQSSGDLNGSWSDVGAPRFAAGVRDSVLLEGSTAYTYYRVKRVR